MDIFRRISESSISIVMCFLSFKSFFSDMAIMCLRNDNHMFEHGTHMFEHMANMCLTKDNRIRDDATTFLKKRGAYLDPKS